MEILEIFLISVGLAMDAFAVSVCKGLSIKKIDWKKAIIIGLWFGTFQAIMPVIGYFLGSSFEGLITDIDHWIAFILLGTIGGKMIKDSLSKDCQTCNDDISFKPMLILAIATSIDALAIGIAYVCAYGSNNAIFTFVSIGIITFLLSIIGVKVGNKFGYKYEKKAEFIGGIMLLLLGMKILLEHSNILV